MVYSTHPGWYSRLKKSAAKFQDLTVSCLYDFPRCFQAILLLTYVFLMISDSFGSLWSVFSCFPMLFLRFPYQIHGVNPIQIPIGAYGIFMEFPKNPRVGFFYLQPCGARDHYKPQKTCFQDDSECVRIAITKILSVSTFFYSETPSGGGEIPISASQPWAELGPI